MSAVNISKPTTKEVAAKLVKLCRENKYTDAIAELYDDNIISLEPKGAPNERTEGKVAVSSKTKNWLVILEQVHSVTISDPISTGNYFSCIMDMDVTLKGIGRVPMNELCVYEVKEGKIVFEQFFYEVIN